MTDTDIKMVRGDISKEQHKLATKKGKKNIDFMKFFEKTVADRKTKTKRVTDNKKY